MGKQTVLVVDDDEAVRLAVRQVLESEGYDVITSSNGREALDTLAASAHPALILLDMMMPEMDGWQFLSQRQSNPVLAQIPVVVFSALRNHGPPEAVDVLSKPVDLDRLLEVVQRHSSQIGGL